MSASDRKSGGPARQSRSPVLRGHLVRMVVWVLAIDAVAIAAYYAGNLSRADERVRMIFTLAWSLATIAVVLTSLRRIRLARRGR
ncbi:MAG: hypothetical protein ACYC2G_03950 [Gemmatimonadaceae bacterium]